MDQKGNSEGRAQDEDQGRKQHSDALGLDVGTSRIVLARGSGANAKIERELNAFVSVPYSKFTENILKQNRVSYHLNGGREIFIFGSESEKFADLFNTEMRRPMRNGVNHSTTASEDEAPRDAMFQRPGCQSRCRVGPRLSRSNAA